MGQGQGQSFGYLCVYIRVGRMPSEQSNLRPTHSESKRIVESTLGNRVGEIMAEREREKQREERRGENGEKEIECVSERERDRERERKSE